MLLSRSLPPHFLLAAWGTRKLLRALQRAHSTTTTVPNPQPPSKPLLETRGDRDTNSVRYDGARSIWGRPNRRASVNKRLEKTQPTSSLVDDQRTHTATEVSRVRYHRGRNERPFAGEEAPIRGPVRRTGSSNFFDQKPNLRFHMSRKGSISPKRLTNSTSSPMSNEEAAKSKPAIGFNMSLDGRSKWGAWFERTEPTNSSPTNELVLESTPDLRHEPTEPTSSLWPDGPEKSKSRVQLEQTEPMNPSSIDEVVLKSTSKLRSERTKPTASLFEELFPEESETTKESERKIVEKLPAFEWDDAPEIDWNETVEKVAEERKNWFEMPSAPKQTGLQMPGEVKRAVRSELSVLVLSCASKTLEQSDFFRLGPKGQHIEGWTSGIIKVIQGRDNVSLEPLGHYFLIFSNEVAASAYLDHTLRLHTLSKTHGSGISPLPFPSKYLHSGEDIKQVLRGYSLVPGQSKLSLSLINRPYSPKLAQLLNDSGPAAIARKKTKSEDMVLFSVDWGRIGHYDLRHAIFNDGKRRNLHWSLIDGKESIVKINDDQGKEEDHTADGSSVNRKTRNTRSPSRYLLSFKDPHEARRFVREWHRRPFPVQKEHKIGDEPPPIMNAEMFW